MKEAALIEKNEKKERRSRSRQASVALPKSVGSGSLPMLVKKVKPKIL
jgi:hypothetical protein